ncbi:MAG: alpha/beta hydrolase [Chitinophagaceae bacterium]
MTTTTQKGYAPVNGINMYYEIYGAGEPLVLVHGGGSTIETSFERVIPAFARNRKVIALELQAHGRTSDRNADSSFEQDADDVAALLRQLVIGKADFLGFSNGATTVLQIAIRHPDIVRKMILGSPLTKRNGIPSWFWDFMQQATLEQVPELLKAGYLKVAPDPAGLQVMHDRDARRMVHFRDIPDELIGAIKKPTLIIVADKDIITPEHALELHRRIEGSELAILPGMHGTYIGEVTTVGADFDESDIAVPLMERFLNR